MWILENRRRQYGVRGVRGPLASCLPTLYLTDALTPETVEAT